jgi:hypothetical protein
MIFVSELSLFQLNTVCLFSKVVYGKMLESWHMPSWSLYFSAKCWWICLVTLACLLA